MSNSTMLVGTFTGPIGERVDLVARIFSPDGDAEDIAMDLGASVDKYLNPERTGEWDETVEQLWNNLRRVA